MRLLLDADATLNLRNLGMLEPLLGSALDVVWTSFVYEHELNSIRDELGLAVTDGSARVEAVLARTPAHRAAKELRREGVDKGEAEAIAWARDTAKDGALLFVSDDVRARRISGKKPPSLTAAECVGLMVAEGIVSREEAEAALVVWDDARNQHGRPRDWESVEVSLPRLIEAAERVLDGLR